MSSDESKPSAPIQPLAGHLVRDEPPVYRGDPYERLDDLMVVVESLCPVWPDRPLRPPNRGLLL